MSAALGAAALAWATLGLAHPPAWTPAAAAGGAPIAEWFPTAGAAVAAFTDGATGVVAFGELHQTTKTARLRSTLSRFTDDILPVVAPRAAHLIVETWVSRGDCGEAEKHVTAEVARTTRRPAETENEIVRLLRRAKELGVAPHVLDVDCHEYQTLVSGGGVDYDRLLTLTGQHLGRAIAEALALPRPPDRPLVLVYGGALHNDLRPAPELAAYSFGPAVDARTGGAYRELDLYLPELVAGLPSLRAEPWFPVWRRALGRKDRAGGVFLIRREPRSAVLVLGPQR